MINSRDSSCDYNLDSIKTYEVPYYVGEILENKSDSNILAMIGEIRINRNGISFLLGFDRNTYDFDNYKIVTKEELVNEWQKSDPSKIIIWGKIPKSSTNSGLSEMMDRMYGHFEATEKGIQLVKRK